MILYLDTSALVKRYFKEPYSKEVIAKFQEATEIVTSSVAYSEAMASFYRKKRESALENDLMEQVIKNFQTEWHSFIRIQVTDQLNNYIDTSLKAHPLRGFDAIHLASAMVIHEKFPDDFLFACFDQKLTQAANTEGMNTFPAINTI